MGIFFRLLIAFVLGEANKLGISWVDFHIAFYGYAYLESLYLVYKFLTTINTLTCLHIVKNFREYLPLAYRMFIPLTSTIVYGLPFSEIFNYYSWFESIYLAVNLLVKIGGETFAKAGLLTSNLAKEIYFSLPIVLFSAFLVYWYIQLSPLLKTWSILRVFKRRVEKSMQDLESIDIINIIKAENFINNKLSSQVIYNIKTIDDLYNLTKEYSPPSINFDPESLRYLDPLLTQARRSLEELSYCIYQARETFRSSNFPKDLLGFLSDFSPINEQFKLRLSFLLIFESNLNFLRIINMQKERDENFVFVDPPIGLQITSLISNLSHQRRVYKNMLTNIKSDENHYSLILRLKSFECLCFLYLKKLIHVQNLCNNEDEIKRLKSKHKGDELEKELKQLEAKNQVILEEADSCNHKPHPFQIDKPTATYMMLRVGEELKALKPASQNSRQSIARSR